MEALQSFIEQIKAAISNGKSDEEIFQFLHPHLEEDPHSIGRLAELMVTLPDRKIGRLLQRMFERTQDKKVRKIIKRSLYRLKSKGVPVEEISPDKESPILRPFQGDPKKGLQAASIFLGPGSCG